MSDIPDEILREILSRLPVAPLLRFRCVSKSWKGLIEDQQFIKHHLNQSQKTDSNLNIILNSRRDLYSADFDLLNETNMATFQQLSHPLIEATYGATQILGSCDGLLVLKNHEVDVTILWNPSVRRFHEIPFCGIEFPGYNRDICYGFGYDVVSDDYKLVRIVRFCGNDDEYNSEVKVYSLKSDSWRRIPDFPYYIDYIWTDGVLANGALHWIVRGKVKSDTDYLIAVLDLGTEEYRFVPLPKLASPENHMILGVVGRCLSIMNCNEDEDHVEVWMMKEYGVQESWSILFAVDIRDNVYLKLIAYSKCGRKVLLRSDERVLMWYDLDKKSTELPMLQMPFEDTDEVLICLQSLVLFNSGTCDFDLFTKKIQKMEEPNMPRS